MSDPGVVYVVGCGAVGMALAACLVMDGKRAVAVRTRDAEASRETINVSLHHDGERAEASVEAVGLSKLKNLDGVVAVTAKAYANRRIALALKNKVQGPLVIMQNGLGVEKAFLDALLPEVYRCVLYVSSNARSDNEFDFHSIKSSPIGIAKGSQAGLDSTVLSLTTNRLPFHPELNLQREIWKKAIMNSVFNSICPLLDVDNGVFIHDQEAAELAHEVVMECLVLTDRLELGLTRAELMQQIMQISRSSDGQLISTLHDIRNGRETEIEFLNLEIARIGASQRPGIDLPKTELLGRMTLARSKQQKKSTA